MRNLPDGHQQSLRVATVRSSPALEPRKDWVRAAGGTSVPIGRWHPIRPAASRSPSQGPRPVRDIVLALEIPRAEALDSGSKTTQKPLVSNPLCPPTGVRRWEHRRWLGMGALNGLLLSALC